MHQFTSCSCIKETLNWFKLKLIENVKTQVVSNSFYRLQSQGIIALWYRKSIRKYTYQNYLYPSWSLLSIYIPLKSEGQLITPEARRDYFHSCPPNFKRKRKFQEHLENSQISANQHISINSVISFRIDLFIMSFIFYLK